MSDINNVFYGPAQISIYDSTNDELAMGYVSEKVKVWQDNLSHVMIDGNIYSYSKRTKFQAEMLETDPAKIAAIVARRGVKQDIFVIGANHVVKLHDVYVSVSQTRDYDPGKTHAMYLTAQTDIEANCEVLVNLLSSTTDGYDYGDMDTGDPLSTGWAQTGLSAYSKTTPSFLGAGHGAHQNITPNSSGDVFYCDITMPLNPVPIKIRAKSWVFLGAPDFGDISFGIKTKNSAGTVLDDKRSNFAIPTAVATECAATFAFTPSEGVETVSAYFQYAGSTYSFKIDEVMLSIGSQDRNYMEND